ncbi:MAG: site-specific DNA-methyltransferase [Xanthobacteraceae bacterium]
MAKRAKSKTGAKADVETYKHKEAKRKNIPTAENQKLIADDDKAVKKLRWQRNPDLDPQLVWRGKDSEPDSLEVDAPPIYIQEKIKPQAIIEDLRRQTKERSKDTAPQFDFFHDFNGLPEGWKEDATQSYYHDEGNWSNRMILGDSLLVMASLAEREGLRGKVQCVYFDPPYGIRFNSNWQPTTKSRRVEDTKLESVSREPEVIRAFRDTWNDGIHSYLEYLRDRLVTCRELLNDTGSIFVQIGLENLHILHGLMDEIFGPSNLVSVVTFQKTGGQSSELLSSVSDYLIWFAKNIDTLKYRQPYHKKELGVGHGSGVRYDQVDEQGRAFQLTSLTSNRPPGSFPVVFEGEQYGPTGGFWKTGEIGFRRLIKADRVKLAGRTLRYQRFIDDFPAYEITNSWLDTAGSPGKIYVVQTSPAVIERCLLMATDPGDLVLDPTCGSGTTAYVAERWGRRWITIDTSRVALTLARTRLMGATYDYYLLKDSQEGAEKEGEIIGKPPADGPFTNNIRHGFVYERAPHVMLKTIADDAGIDAIWERWQKALDPLREKLSKALKKNWQEWEVPREADEKWSPAAKEIHAAWWEARRARQKEIDDSIARNAKVEYLYDRPYKARGVVRVAGPFTVESLSPHRVLPMGEDPYLEGILGAGEGDPSPLVGEGREGGREVTHPAVTAA